ncbi:hypothetical protein CDAR_281881 [Caerostris darwini]|uniref:Uncharacterized protein n=1 Tax=Caerostris darwini TaxID=1538125 RepID=A0AAV4WQJ4_9ARAC|nr:hypothetical protein CDAR_281881 [Caerostris darwini]
MTYSSNAKSCLVSKQTTTVYVAKDALKHRKKTEFTRKEGNRPIFRSLSPKFKRDGFSDTINLWRYPGLDRTRSQTAISSLIAHLMVRHSR